MKLVQAPAEQTCMHCWALEVRVPGTVVCNACWNTLYGDRPKPRPSVTLRGERTKLKAIPTNYELVFSLLEASGGNVTPAELARLAVEKEMYVPDSIGTYLSNMCRRGTARRIGQHPKARYFTAEQFEQFTALQPSLAS